MTEENTATTETPPSINFDDFKAALPETTRGLLDKAGVKDFETFDKDYTGLTSLIGKKGLIKPEDTAPDEVKAEYNKKLFAEIGVPEDGVYNVEAPEGWNNDNGLGQEVLDGLAELGLKNGLSTGAYKEVLGLMNETAGKLKAQSAELFGTNDALQKEWGESFETNSKLAEQFVEKTLPEAKTLLELPVFKKFAAEIAKKTGDDTLKNDSSTQISTADMQNELNELTKEAIAARNKGDYKAAEAIDAKRQVILAKL